MDSLHVTFTVFFCFILGWIAGYLTKASDGLLYVPLVLAVILFFVTLFKIVYIE